MNLKETAEKMVEKLTEPPLPKHTKESDFERLKHDHRALCATAMEKEALILEQLRDMANAGVLGAEFRPIILFTRDAYDATEQIRIMGDDLIAEYRNAVNPANAEIDKREKKRAESRKLKDELDETIAKHIGKRGEKEEKGAKK